MRLLRIILVLTYLLCVNIISIQSQDETHPLGTNLTGIASWNPVWQFVDVFRTARPWISQCDGCGWGEGEPLDLSPEGWVKSLQDGQYAETVMLDGGVYPDGTYILTYEGEGEIVFSMDSAEMTSNSTGRITFNIKGNNGIWLQIRATNPDNYIRNIHIYMPTIGDLPFHPDFLASLDGFTTLRFMDWMATNNSQIITWDDRPKMTDAQWHEKGVPIEMMVLLANIQNADAWFNMPHMADDDYIRQFANYVRDNLNPNLRAYIEYSNETWNSQFSQAQYVIEQGRALGLSNDDFQAGLFYHSHRAGEIFAIWEDVFGGTDRLVRVLASQGANAWTGEQVLTYNNMYQVTDALAIAPYFGGYLGDPATIDDVVAQGINGVIDASRAHINGEVSNWIRDNVTVASRYGVELVAYEGGQHLVGFWGAEGDERLTDVFISANRDPRMGDLYTEYLNQWYGLGGGLMMNFSHIVSPSQWGSWGILEYQNQPRAEAPKYDAIMRYLGK